MAGCKSCQRGGNAGETMGGSPQLTGGEPTDMPEGMEEGSLQGAAGGDPTAEPPVMQGGSCGKCGSKKKHGGMLQKAAAPILLTLAAASPKVRRTLSLGLLKKGGKKSRKAKGKGKGKKTKGKKVKKGKKTRKYHKRR